MISSNAVNRLLDDLPKFLAANSRKAQEVGKIIALEVKGRDGVKTLRVLSCTQPVPLVLYTVQPSTDLTIEILEEDLEILLREPLAALQLFFQNRIKVSGDTAALKALAELFRNDYQFPSA